MDINFDKVFCIDLMKYNDQTLREFADFFGLNGDAICFNKKNGLKKYYIYLNITDTDTGYLGGHDVIAIEFKENCKLDTEGPLYKGIKLNVPLSRRQIDKLIKVKPFDFISFRKKQNKIETEEKRQQKLQTQDTAISNSKIQGSKSFELDDILDKISKFGIDSLSRNERKFLDGLAN